MSQQWKDKIRGHAKPRHVTFFMADAKNLREINKCLNTDKNIE